jgi:ribosomal subunit interface protein
MLLPLQITFRNMEPSAALEARIRKLAQRLEKFSSQIVRCHVIVEMPHKHGHQGSLYEIHVHLTTPGDTIVANREHRERHSHEDAYVALRDAFHAVRRQLEDYERKRRQDVKHRDTEPIGWVSELYPAEDFGRIQTSDGHSLYFHRHSVVGADFDRLTTGTAVRFVEGSGERGPQASTVKLVTHPGPVT